MLGTYRGADLLGVRYLPPFAYFLDSPKAFQVLSADFVTTEDGTGLVHMAPAYGEDDMATTDPVGIVPVTPVDSKDASTRRSRITRDSMSLRRTRTSSAT